MEVLKCVLFLFVWYSFAQSQDQCALQNGSCSYHVTLAPQCQAIGEVSPSRIPEQPDQRVDRLEKELQDMHADFGRKIRELEVKFANFVRMQTLRSADEPSSSGFEPGNSNETDDGEYVFKTPNPENVLLNDIHDEFLAIRRELTETKTHLQESQTELGRTQDQLRETEAKLWSVTQVLVNTEEDVQLTSSENGNLKDILKDTMDNLVAVQGELDEVKGHMASYSVQLLELREERDSLQEMHASCWADLNVARDGWERQNMTLRSLTVTHANTTQELSNTMGQLVECQTGKSSMSCSFEDSGLCGFQTDNVTSELAWTWWRLNTPSPDTGPVRDHTCGSPRGHYMYVEASHRAPGQKARLVSPTFHGTGPQCVIFYYHMFGNHVGTLNVYTTELDPTVPLSDFGPRWRVYGNQGNMWSSGRLDVPHYTARAGYKVTFEATIGHGYQGDIAIDDFLLADGYCASIPEVRQPEVPTRRRVKVRQNPSRN